MKKPLIIISNDKHLTNKNIDIFEDLCKQEIDLALKNGVKNILWLGDIFDSRVAQREDVLNSVGKCIEKYYNAGLEIFCIPGNHDKTIYSSETSFLDSFKYHPGFNLFNEPSLLNISGIKILFIPFFSDDKWIEYFNLYKDKIDKDTILCSHIAVNGSRNNDGTTVETNITPTLLSEFKLVFLGHYHNTQKIGDNIYHLPSTYQRNFGEDNLKGFTIYYDDGTHEIVKSNFKEFISIKLDTDELTDEEIICLAKENSCSKNNVRFELIGDKDRIKSIDKNKISSIGVDVKIKFKELEIDEKIVRDEVKEFTEEEILKKFEYFCRDKGYKFNVGKKYLVEVCQKV